MHGATVENITVYVPIHQ